MAVYVMEKFDKEQKIFEIADVKVGGQPGELPTVLIGTIFYEGHKIVNDHRKGTFDKQKAESLLNKQEEMSDLTGNPCIIDVFGQTSEALINYIDFISEASKAPFLVDSTSANERIPAIKHAIEIGLRNRAIYNSIDYNFNDDELNELKNLKTESAVVLCYNPLNAWPKGRTEILKGTDRAESLLEAAEKAGISNMLVDTAVLDVPSIIFASEAINLVKKELGLPAGCGPSNAITTWRKVRKGMGPYAYDSCLSGACIVTQMYYADFTLYGPIEFAEKVFPACAMTDAITTYNARSIGIKPATTEHPLTKIFKD